jgi:repressor LexA
MQNQISNKEIEALQAIRSYLMKHGRMPSVRELMKELHYKSPRSASVVMQGLIDKGILKKKKDGSTQLMQYEIDEFGDTPQEQTVKVPLLGTVTCGLPILSEENIEAELAVSTKVAKQPGTYYLLRTQGDSMNQKGISDGDLVLVKHQNNADNGDTVVALIDDEVTVKELRVNNDNVVLLPRSSNKTHMPIILSKDFVLQGVVVSVIPM